MAKLKLALTQTRSKIKHVEKWKKDEEKASRAVCGDEDPEAFVYKCNKNLFTRLDAWREEFEATEESLQQQVRLGGELWGPRAKHFTGATFFALASFVFRPLTLCRSRRWRAPRTRPT